MYVSILQIHLIIKIIIHIIMHNLYGIYGILFIDEKCFFSNFQRFQHFFNFKYNFIWRYVL